MLEELKCPRCFDSMKPSRETFSGGLRRPHQQFVCQKCGHKIYHPAGAADKGEDEDNGS